MINPSNEQYNIAPNKMQYHLIYDKVDEKGMCHRNIMISFDNKDEANESYKGLKASGAANIRAFSDADKCICVDVEFVRGGKRYTYLHHELADVNQLAVVNTRNGMVVVKVVGCSIRLRKELETKMPFENYKHLVGLVK